MRKQNTPSVHDKAMQEFAEFAKREAELLGIANDSEEGDKEEEKKEESKEERKTAG